MPWSAPNFEGDVGKNSSRFNRAKGGGGWVHRPRASVRTHGDTRLRFDAPRDDEAFPARAHLHCGYVLTPVRPEAQKRLICTPPTVSGRPAASMRVRAMSALLSLRGPHHAEHHIVRCERGRGQDCAF